MSDIKNRTTKQLTNSNLKCNNSFIKFDSESPFGYTWALDLMYMYTFRVDVVGTFFFHIVKCNGKPKPKIVNIKNAKFKNEKKRRNDQDILGYLVKR